MILGISFENTLENKKMEYKTERSIIMSIPMQPKAAPPPPPVQAQTYMAPENYIFHKDSGLYYSLVVIKNDNGDWVDFVTWFDTKTGEYAQVEYPHIVKTTVEKERRKINFNTIRGIAALIFLIVIGTGVWYFKPYENLKVSFGKSVEPQETTSQKENSSEEVEVQVVEKESPKEQLSNKKKETNENKYLAENVMPTKELLASKNEEQVYSVDPSQNDFEPRFGHAILFYMLADEDEDYVYALHQDYVNWKYSMEGIYGDLYRIPKNEKDAVPEKILDIAGPEDEITAFAVLGENIYFAINLHHTESGVDQFAYYKIPKTGGTAEYLFTDEGSFIRSYKGKVYFLFRERNQLCSYDPSTDNRHYEALDLSTLYDVMSGGARSEFTLFMPFSIYDGCVYLGGMFDYKYYYGKYNLESKKIMPIINGDLSFALESDEGGVAIYGVNPILEEDNGNVINSDPNGILAKTNEDIFVTFKTINNKYSFERFYFEKNGFRKEPLPSINFQNDTFAYGAVGDWILFNDMGICIKSERIDRTISFKNFKDSTSNWNLDAVNELINKYNEYYY